MQIEVKVTADELAEMELTKNELAIAVLEKLDEDVAHPTKGQTSLSGFNVNVVVVP